MNRFTRRVHQDAECSPNERAPVRRTRARWWAPLFGGALIASCGQVGDDAVVGGETHFLVTCEQGCGAGLTCIDGACTRRCEPGYSSCSELAAEATCVSPPEADGERSVFAGTCDLLCSTDPDCTSLGVGFSCRSGACRAEPEAREAELSSALSGTPLVRAVDAATCQTGLRWVGGDHSSGEMRPGSDCVGCHREEGARPLLLGGTVYPTGGRRTPLPLDDCFGIEGISVRVVDAAGRERSTVTNRAGNFYFEGEESELALPYQASIGYSVDGQELLAAMFTLPSYGGCVRCHADDGRQGETPYTANPLESEVVSTGPIFPPGLFPD
jgi:mono/diheme cytochrome c family protein